MTLPLNHPVPSSGNSPNSYSPHFFVLMKRIFWFKLILLIVLGGVQTAAGQNNVPTIPMAETNFNLGLRAFDEKTYDVAYDRFRLITELPVNTRTTASWLMAGKSLFALGQFDDAIQLLTRFIEMYPESKYIAFANETKQLSETQKQVALAPAGPIFNLGIILPTDSTNLPITQTLFNGIRLAVDEYNQSNPGVQVRMIFRPAVSYRSEAKDLIEQLAREQTEAVIGPLFSENVNIFAAASEEARLPLIAPLATDENIVRSRDFTFLANPSFKMRGRIMAKFALAHGLDSTVGVIAQAGTRGEDMARAFRAETIKLGGSVPLFQIFQSGTQWYRFPDEIDRDSLRKVESLYLPITGSGARAQIRAVASGLNRLFVSGKQLLGNTEWHGIGLGRQAQRTVYAYDFVANEERIEVQHFITAYRALAGQDPSRVAYAGYDTAKFLLAQIAKRLPGQNMRDVIANAPQYNGLGSRILFENEQVNKKMFFIGFDDQGQPIEVR